MDKNDYLAARLEHDFIRYVLLREPQYTDADISRKLKDKINADLLYANLRQHITPVVDQYLSEDKLKDKTGKPVAVLPDWLTPELADKVAGEYCEEIRREYSAINFVPNILAHIERLTWAQGVDDMAVNLRRFVDDLGQMAHHYANIAPCKPEYYEIGLKYEEAKRITIGEQVMRSNNRDIANFLEAMRTYCTDLCLYHLSIMLSRLYADIAASPAILDLIDKFARLHSEAESRLHTLPTGVPAEWEAEYSHLFPILFFEQNIEDISAPVAFRNILLTTFAHHEGILRQEHGLSDKGDLTLFTSPFPLLSTSLFSKIIN